MHPNQLLTVSDAARQLGLKHQALRRAIKRGELPAMKICSRIRIDPDELRSWVEERRVRPQDTADLSVVANPPRGELRG
jgi:excisionase family DNA binding protein